MNQPPPNGCANAAFTVVTLTILGSVIALAIVFREQINQTAEDYRRLPARVQALEESVRNTNESFTKYLKP